MAVHILGIRHHGPGSAKNVQQYLAEIKPDIVLVEGPPEADDILQWASHAALKPPVAILCYQPDNPQSSTFYPFAEFSPEWQAISYARKNNIHVRFIDLPIGQQFAVGQEMSVPVSAETGTDQDNTVPADDAKLLRDPVSYLAEAAGYADGEKWWEEMFEHRFNNEAVFMAVKEAMETLREAFPGKTDRLEQLREAHMRKLIRQAEREMFQNIAVVCGAWHAPALANMGKQKDDNDLLKGLPRVKSACTWIPWTYKRLSFNSGYGAGIHSPGWYEHVWNFPGDDGTIWMAKVAKLFREKQMDTSVAHVIEATRLANALASLRGLHKAGLEELNEAMLSVLCNGDPVMMGLIGEALIVSNRIGEVPEDIPKPPLQLDIEKTQKKLRLPATADWKEYTLDLRKETDLERSVFLHRLLLLEIQWGKQSGVNGKGTFKELWRLQWEPEFSIGIIEKGTYGNTMEEAATNYVMEQVQKADQLAGVCRLLENAIPAGLSLAVAALVQKLNNLAAASGDVVQLMEVIPGLVNITRYGDVRKTDAALVMEIAESMITRICVSLPSACTGIDEDASQHLLDLLFKMNDAVSVLQHPETTTGWQQTLQVISLNPNTAPAVSGYAIRLLSDYNLLSGEELNRAFFFAMSTATMPSIAAVWLEGFLKGGGTLLLLDNNIWTIIDGWVKQLPEPDFILVLPLLRRTFANFSPSERRKLGEKVKSGGKGTMIKMDKGFDAERGKRGLPVIMQLLGYKIN